MPNRFKDFSTKKSDQTNKFERIHNLIFHFYIRMFIHLEHTHTHQLASHKSFIFIFEIYRKQIQCMPTREVVNIFSASFLSEFLSLDFS